MSEVFYVLIGFLAGLLAGGAAAWLVSAARSEKLHAQWHARSLERLGEAEARASSAEALLKELREQALRTGDELSTVRQALEAERALSAGSQAELKAAHENLAQQRAMLEAMKKELADTFGSLSAAALKSSSEDFLRLASEHLKAQLVQGTRELEGKRELIGQSIEAMAGKLIEVQRRVEEVGQGSVQKMLEVSGQIKHQAEATLKLSETAENLRRTLASSKKRGEWGERMAEDIIRLAGLIEGVNYLKQKSLGHAPGIPDYTFLLPGNLKINMDVKFPLDNYRHYLEAATDADRKRYREELLKNARVMIKQVTSREYINPDLDTVDYVIVFIPNEQVYGFLNESDSALMDDSLRQKVILCSPFTLYAVLAVVRQAVDNFNLERTASEILGILGTFFKQWNLFKEKLKSMGDRLESARKEYDALVTTRSNQLERPLRKIEELRRSKSIQLEETMDLDE